MKSISGICMTIFFVCSSSLLADGGAADLHDLFAREWEDRMAEDPLLATSVGRHEYDHRLPDVTSAAQKRRGEKARGFLEELAAIDRDSLSKTDGVSYDMFRRQLELRLADIEFGDYELPVNADSGFHTDFARLPNDMPLDDVDGYEDYLARLRAFPVYVAQQVANMRRGLERSMSLPRVVLDGIEVTMATHIVEDSRQSVFWAPFESFPAGVPESEHERLRREGGAAIVDRVVAGYQSFLDFMVEEYIPGSRESLGASELPEGSEYYRHKIRTFTTLDLAPEEIHQIGLGHVARIRSEMEAVIAEVGFAGTFAEFLEFLRTDPRFYAESPEALLKEAAYIAKRMDGKLPALFGRLPRLPYTVEPVPDYLAPKYTTGRYVGAPWGGSEPGRYWVNTYNLASRPLYNLEALSLHEAVPGHHLQIALNQEIEGLPNFRRFSYISAFGEGWGLYSEWLGLEAGFYTDPYSNFGRLTYEMWRACRLVVDTGVHAFGWTREQMIDFLASNTALPLHEVETETDRYISWPGQALSYKLGEIEIRKLRLEAEEALGERFDVRAFHDAVLANGSVPLPVLRQAIEGFIGKQR
jgi:uncharacterized protein (DUF885 family)